MSYSALTEIGIRPTCPLCKAEILPDTNIACVLYTTADLVPTYLAENEMEAGTLTAYIDWHKQEVYHQECAMSKLEGEQ